MFHACRDSSCSGLVVAGGVVEARANPYIQCPIHGVSVVRPSDIMSWHIQNGLLMLSPLPTLNCLCPHGQWPHCLWSNILGVNSELFSVVLSLMPTVLSNQVTKIVFPAQYACPVLCWPGSSLLLLKRAQTTSQPQGHLLSAIPLPGASLIHHRTGLWGLY